MLTVNPTTLTDKVFSALLIVLIQQEFLEKDLKTIKKTVMKNTQKLSVGFGLVAKRAKNGEAPIYTKIYVDGKRLEISTGYSINPKFWNNVTGKVRSSYPEYNHYNTKLADIKVEIKREFLLMTALGPIVTVQELKENTYTKKINQFTKLFVKLSMTTISKWSNCKKQKNYQMKPCFVIRSLKTK